MVLLLVLSDVLPVVCQPAGVTDFQAQSMFLTITLVILAHIFKVLLSVCEVVQSTFFRQPAFVTTIISAVSSGVAREAFRFVSKSSSLASVPVLGELLKRQFFLATPASFRLHYS